MEEKEWREGDGGKRRKNKNLVEERAKGERQVGMARDKGKRRREEGRGKEREGGREGHRGRTLETPRTHTYPKRRPLI